MNLQALTYPIFDAFVARYAQRLEYFGKKFLLAAFPETEKPNAVSEASLSLIISQMLDAKSQEAKGALQVFDARYRLGQPLYQSLVEIAVELGQKPISVQGKSTRFSRVEDELVASVEEVPLMTRHEGDLLDQPTPVTVFKFVVATYAARKVSGMANDQLAFDEVVKQMKGVGALAQKVGLTLDRIEWNGTQKQLADLFIALFEKGWIKQNKPKTITAAFTKAETIAQVMKPGRQPGKYEATWEELARDGYERIFSGLPDFESAASNSKSDKK